MIVIRNLQYTQQAYRMNMTKNKNKKTVRCESRHAMRERSIISFKHPARCSESVVLFLFYRARRQTPAKERRRRRRKTIVMIIIWNEINAIISHTVADASTKLINYSSSWLNKRLNKKKNHCGILYAHGKTTTTAVWTYQSFDAFNYRNRNYS